MFINEGLAGFFLCRVERVYLSDLGNEGIFEFDGMVKRVMWGKDVIGLFRENISKGRTEVWDRNVLRFVSLSKLSQDGDLVDVYVCPSCLKAILMKRPVISGRRRNCC